MFHVKFKSVRTKLLASFGVVCALLAIVGWIGIQKETAIANHGDSIYNESLLPLGKLAELQREFRSARFDVVDATMNSGDQTPLINQIQHELGTVDTTW